MEQPLIYRSSVIQLKHTYSRIEHNVTFRQCLRLIGGKQRYQKRLFLLMASYWIIASFFISIEFFLFKKSIYCESGFSKCCRQGDLICTSQICQNYADSIFQHIKRERTLTFDFRLFCSYDLVRVLLKTLPQTLSFIGFIIYGHIADLKGRATAISISWRLFTFGVVTYATTEAIYLKMFGYIIACIHCLPSLVIQFVLFFQQNIEKQRNRTCLFLLACLFVGPLVLSFTSSIISKLDNRITLSVLCAIPAFILSIIVYRLNESAVFIYPYDKLGAFNIINKIAKQNKKPPIFIDLSRSNWHRYINLKPESAFFLLLKKQVRLKLILGFLFMFSIYYNIKMAQVSLDTYTSAYSRSILINLPTSLADITLCIFLVRFQNRTCKNIFIGVIWLESIIIICHQIGLCNQIMGIVVVGNSMVIRYLSQLCYGIMIIWSIQTFPTINRASCTTFVFSGTAFGCMLVYSLRQYVLLLYFISIFLTLLMMLLERHLQLQKYGTMYDTFEKEYYDQNDKFYKM